MARDPDLSVVIVNYNSAALTCELVSSLQAESFRGREGEDGILEIIVVDSASPIDQRDGLRSLEDKGVRLEFSEKNLGYGGGCNHGFRLARGEFVMLMNPDVLLVPGALDVMIRYLRDNPDVGQVGPRGWFDASRFFYLPSIEIPTVRTLIRQIRARMSRRRAREFAMRRTRHALSVWTTREPLVEEVIAGYAFMMRTDVAHKFGPFDEAYPFYFEDSDLSRRLRESGLKCVLHPDAEMIHFYNKSAGQVYEEAMRKHGDSQRIYFERHYGEEIAKLTEVLPDMIQRHGALMRGWTFADAQPIGDYDTPPSLSLPRSCSRFLAELTLDPMFSLAVGHIGSGDTFRISDEAWKALEPAAFFVRVIDLERMETLGTWSFNKTAPIAPVPGYEEFLTILGSGAERSL